MFAFLYMTIRSWHDFMTCDSEVTAPAFGMACKIMAPVVVRKGRLAAVLTALWH